MPKGTKDPYDFDVETALQEQEKKLSQRGFSGVFCPRKNSGEKCMICRDVDSLWRAHNDTGLERSQFSEKARKYGASAHVYMNVVMPDEPSEVKVMRCGIKMCQAIVNGMRYTGWGNVIHPDKGHTMIVHKTKGEGGYNTYNPSPDFKTGPRQLADKSVLDRRYNLDEMDDLRNQGVEEFNISSLGDNKVIRFDILPGWKADAPQEFFKVLYYHYNVSPEAVEVGVQDPVLTPTTNGKSDVDYGVEEEVFKDNAPKAEPMVDRTAQPVPEMKFTMQNKPSCFGREYEPDDPTEGGCADPMCEDIAVACARATAKYRAKSKPQPVEDDIPF